MKRSLYLLAIVLVTFILAHPLRGAAAPAPAKKTPSKEAAAKEVPVKTAPVKLGRTAIFSVPEYRALTAEERANMVAGRIARIADDFTIETKEITTADSDVTSDVMAGDRIIMSVYDIDGQAVGMTRQELAREYTGKLRTAVEQYRQERTPQNISRGILLSSVATLALLLLLLLNRLLFRKLLEVLETRRARPIHFQRFEVLRLDQVKAFFNGCIRSVKLLIILVLLYIYADLTLSFFPWTRPFSGEILHYLLVPLKTMGKGIISYIPNLIFLVVLVFVTHFVLKFLRLVSEEVENGNITFTGFYPEWSRPTYKIVRFLVIAFVAVVAFPYFPGAESPAFKGISIFLGVLFSLGSSSTIANTIAGVDMTYRRAFKIGDWIKIGEFTGEVTRTRLQVTHLRTYKNEEVIISNAVMLNSNLINYSSLVREHGLILHTAVTIGYSTPWRQIHAMMIQAAERTPDLLRTPTPFVLQTALDDFYVRYELNVYTESPQYIPRIFSDLHRNIQDAFNEYGVQIMSPHYIDDPKSPAIVPQEQWYAAPAKPPADSEVKA